MDAFGGPGELLLDCSRRGDIEGVRWRLLLNNSIINYRCEESGASALMIAARKGHEEIVEILLANGADVHLIDRHGDNALFYAVGSNNETTLKLLLCTGVDVNYCTFSGYSALAKACLWGQEKHACILLDAGADMRLPKIRARPHLYGHGATFYMSEKKEDVVIRHAKTIHIRMLTLQQKAWLCLLVSLNDESIQLLPMIVRDNLQHWTQTFRDEQLTKEEREHDCWAFLSRIT